MKDIAVEGMTLDYDGSVTGPTPEPGAPSAVARVDGNGIYVDGLSITAPTGVVDGDCTTTSPATESMNATAEENRLEGSPPLREDDTVDFSEVPGVDGSGNACTASFTVRIVSAGQNVARAE